MGKTVVLLSGGIDSTTCLGYACEEEGRENIIALSILYGQKHCKELICAEQVAKFYGIERKVLDLSEIMKFSNSPLLSKSSIEIRHESYAEQIKKDGEGMVDTFVPFRNGLLLSTAASIAMSLFPKEEVTIYYGAHKDDAAGRAYPDCSNEFVAPMAAAIKEGSGGFLKLRAPFINNSKKEIIKLGLELSVPYSLTWSCYEGDEFACGTCATCIDRKAAFHQNNVADPIKYAK